MLSEIRVDCSIHSGTLVRSSVGRDWFQGLYVDSGAYRIRDVKCVWYLQCYQNATKYKYINELATTMK